MKMDENKTIIIEKMVTYENGLISEEHNFNEDTLCEWVLIILKKKTIQKCLTMHLNTGLIP